MARTEIEQLLQFEFEGLAPSGEVRRLMRIRPDGLLEHLAKTGNRSKIEECWLVPDILMSPAGIWKGLNREHQEEAFCYSGVPLGAFADEHGKAVEIAMGKVFLVFLTENLDAVKWRYAQQDPKRAGFPVGHDTRFGARLWPRD